MNINDFSEVKIEVYLPEVNLAQLQSALHQAGAGIVGNYDNVFATTKVTGHWRPLEGANPAIGTIGEIETAPEIKLEINCKRELISEVLKAIHANHPYEEPLIRVIPILNKFFE